jgi:inner membrane protein
MAWWLWVVLGMALLALEMAMPGGLFALFFGLSAIIVGILTALGVSGPAWLQWLLFSGLAVLDLVLLRGPLHGRLNLRGSRRPVDSMIGDAGTILEDLPAGGVGKVEVRGSAWTARGTGAPLAKGQRCRVERVEGLTLWVRPE